MRVKNKDSEVDANELKDLNVERVDGVDKPATGRKFLLFKSESTAQRVMKAAGGLFGDVVFGTPVAKSVRESLPGKGGIEPVGADRVAAALDSWSGKTTDATKAPTLPSTSGFTKPGPTHGAVKAGPNYGFKDAWLSGELFSDVDPGFGGAAPSGIPAAANFKPTEPGEMANDGAGMQFSKSALEWAYFDAVSVGDKELAAAIKSKLAKHGVDIVKSAAIEWPAGPARHWKR